MRPGGMKKIGEVLEGMGAEDWAPHRRQAERFRQIEEALRRLLAEDGLGDVVCRAASLDGGALSAGGGQSLGLRPSSANARFAIGAVAGAIPRHPRIALWRSALIFFRLSSAFSKVGVLILHIDGADAGDAGV